MFGIPIWAWLGVAAVAASSKPKRRTTRARAGFKISASSATPGDDAPGIRTWGTHEGDTATWNPTYLKSEGCKDFRFGACLDKWIDDLEKQLGSPEDAGERVAFFFKDLLGLVESWGNAAVPLAGWLVARQCIRFKLRIHAYKDQDGRRGFAIDKRSGDALDAAAPPIPLAPRKGWKRVWMSAPGSGVGNSVRSPNTFVVFWPSSEEGGPIIKDVAGTDVIRAMLRMDADEGALKIGELQRRTGCRPMLAWATLNRGAALRDYK